MASQDETRASANLLQRSLRDSVEACPEPEILAAYFERSLDADETRRYELHLSKCARCREQFAAMHRAGEPAPAEAAVPHTRSHWAWLWDWRFLAPAVAVLVIAAVWLARRPTVNPANEKIAQPLVAMNRDDVQKYSPIAPAPPEPSSRAEAQPPNQSLVAPETGSRGGIKQNPAMTTESRTTEDKKELASNQALAGGNARELDEMKKDEDSRRRDLADATSGAATGVPSSRAAAAPAPAAPPPPPLASSSPEPSRVNGGAIGGAIVADNEIAAAPPETAKTKPSGSPTLVRPMTGQEQRQAIAQSEAVVTGAVERRSAGKIVPTPDPKVVWRFSSSVVEVSTDAGATWQKQQLRSFEPNPQITAGFAPTAKICWLVGRGGVILLTRDASHWVPIPPPVSVDFVGVTAHDNFSATVTAADGRKFSTEDAGDHWKPAP